MTQENEVEVVDETPELPPEGSGVVGAALGITDQIALAENIGKIVEAQNKIRMALLKLAQPGDWVVFSDESKAKAEIGFAGSMRIGSTLGVNFTNWSALKEQDTDEKGPWYRWNFECDASFKGRTVRVYGRAGSRDKFFGKAYGQFKELHDIDEGNIKMAARRGAMKEGVKVLFGLHHMDPKELEKFGVKLESAGGYGFDKKKEAEELKTVTVNVADVTMKDGGKWKLYKVKDAEGAIYSTFDKKLSDLAVQAAKDKKMVTITYSDGKYGPEIKGLEVKS